MKLYVANVGVNAADAARRGIRSPVFPDGTFEFVPIKESQRFCEMENIPTYRDLTSWTGRAKSLAEFLPEKVHDYRVHADPEFETFTYGDVLSPRAANLKSIAPHDQLWFLARLWEHDETRWTGASDFYLIAFIEVEQTHLIEAGSGDLPPALIKRIQNNAHYRRMAAGDTSACRILLGKPDESFRFDQALKVTPQVAGFVLGGVYDESSGIFKSGDQVLRNKNGSPRRFERFGSITRAIQPFLDSRFSEQKRCIETLRDLATAK